MTLVLRKSREAGSHRQRLQSVLFEDRKTATYKLALLRALCDIALAAPLAAQFVSKTHVAVPMGLIVERWISFYWPLAGLPQLSGHRPMEFEAALARLAALFAGDYFACRRGMEANCLDAPAREALGAVASVMLKTVSSKAPKSTITSRRSHVRSQDGNCSTPQVMCHNGSQINDSVSKGTLFTVSQMPLLHDVLPARVPKNLSNPAFLLSSPAEKQTQCTSTTFAPTLLMSLFAKAFIRCVAHYHNFSKFSNTVTILEGLCFASQTLKRGPIEHSGTSAGDRLFAWRKSEAAPPCASPLEALRQTSGQLLLPGSLWREMKQNGLWFSDSILLQWAQLVEKFSGGEAPMGDVLSRLLSTQGSERDTAEARALYARKPDLACVWTGEPLAGRVFAVDHLLSWALTRTNDLWNLLPALPKANSAKSDKLPDFEFFLSRRNGIVDDWRWLADQDPELFARQSAQALLPAGLPAREWWNPLFDAAGRRLESLAQRLSAPRWLGL